MFGIGASLSILLVLVTWTLTEIKKIMATLDTIKATEEQQVVTLNIISTDLADVSRKVDQLIAQGGGGGTSDQAVIDEIAAIQKQADEQIRALSGTVKTLGQKVDAELGPHPEPQR